MIEKYRSDVLQFFEQKKSAGSLSTNLMNPTPANIRNELRLLFEAGCDHIDKRTLKEFLEWPFEKEISGFTLKKCDPDKFKPLCNFLKKDIGTREKNIELLAWLIDFRPRPFSNYWRLSNARPDILSELSITEEGIVEEKKIEAQSLLIPDLLNQRKSYEKTNYSRHKQNQDIATVKEEPDYTYLIATERCNQKEITLEYPSGVKLSVDASDLSLIAKLLRL